MVDWLVLGEEDADSEEMGAFGCARRWGAGGGVKEVCNRSEELFGTNERLGGGQRLTRVGATFRRRFGQKPRGPRR